MALVMDPVAAGAVLAPMFCVSDMCRSPRRASTWSKPDLMVLIPGQLIGVGLGFAIMSRRSPPHRHRDRARHARRGVCPRRRHRAVTVSSAKALWPAERLAIASMVAHSGGPPVAMYLLPLGLPKSIYAGTTFMFFVFANFAKVGPWLLLARPTRELWLLMALALPVIPFGVWSGWRLHERLDQQQLYRACYALLIVVALKLLWDGLSGYAR
jgi:uncharacterized membrane protein YfcA